MSTPAISVVPTSTWGMQNKLFLFIAVATVEWWSLAKIRTICVYFCLELVITYSVNSCRKKTQSVNIAQYAPTNVTRITSRNDRWLNGADIAVSCNER